MNVTKKELATLLGVSLRTITLWQQAGMPVMENAGRGRKNRYCTQAVAEWLAKKKGPLSDPPKDQQLPSMPRRDAWGGKY
jgi:phage terminase Nu1 subunit (DNA packaging protein)